MGGGPIFGEAPIIGRMNYGLGQGQVIPWSRTSLEAFSDVERTVKKKTPRGFY